MKHGDEFDAYGIRWRFDVDEDADCVGDPPRYVDRTTYRLHAIVDGSPWFALVWDGEWTLDVDVNLPDPV